MKARVFLAAPPALRPGTLRFRILQRAGPDLLVTRSKQQLACGKLQQKRTDATPALDRASCNDKDTVRKTKPALLISKGPS